MSRADYAAYRRMSVRQDLRNLGKARDRKPVLTGSRYQLIDTVTGEVVLPRRRGSYKRRAPKQHGGFIWEFLGGAFLAVFVLAYLVG